ncbi:ROK family transcriptional regulator [Sphingomonas sp. AR_OL41]|uniref:ROK family transcriptional regulator n=1 Tax=Sphingomonas sp. AR_OL41 TaxID=3042729 RepID=UPI00248137C0|nr:ROK family transcriptional regulator [Sphingomonas sp. AR_OL41]MDH7972819.1 ROK family transcriptional regulator [Sphingomonas sp. AR_OL41]
MSRSERVPAGSEFTSLDRVNLFSTGLSGTNLERGGSHNLRVTLQAIRLNAPITKVELAEITGLTPPSMTNITRKLLADGLIVETGRRRGERGQPAMELAINADGAFSVGINIDRDHITMVALDFLGCVRARIAEEIAFAMPEQVTDFFTRNLEAIRASGAVDMDRIAGVGVAIPDDFGRVDMPLRPSDFGIWETFDLRRLFAAHGLDVFIENDACAAAMGEFQFGHGQTAQTFLYVLISAGLGGGLVIDGHPVRGASGRSGEIGFLPIGRARRNPVNLQDVVSLSGLFAHLETVGHRDISVAGLGKLKGAIAKEALVWTERAADLLCEPLLVINAAIDPEAVFIGGRLPAKLLDSLVDRLAVNIRHRGASLPSRAPVLRAALAEDAAAMGAAILPFSSRFLPSRAALMKTEV